MKNGSKSVNTTFSKHNSFILAKYNMTTYELKIIMLCCAQIKMNILKAKKDLLDFYIPIHVIRSFVCPNTNNYKKLINAAAERLINQKIEIKKSDGSFTFIRPFPYVDYDSKNSLLHVRFEKCMEEQLINLASEYTSYKLSSFSSLKSSFAIRLFEILTIDAPPDYQDNNSQKFVFELDDCKAMIGAAKLVPIDPTKDLTSSNSTYKYFHKEFYNFRLRVLDPAITEINGKTAYNVSYEPTYNNRNKVTHIIFTISPKEDFVQDLTENEIYLDFNT